MKNEKDLQPTRKRESSPRTAGDPLHNFVFLTVCALLAVIIAIGSKVLDNDGHTKVYAAAGMEDAVASASSGTAFAAQDYLPTGIAGVVSGVRETPIPGSTVKRIGTSCETVMVGQRVKTVEGGVTEFNASSSMANTVNDLDSRSISLAETPKIMSDSDYDTLLRIVEAEAGSEDIKGRIMVANVIMNRVRNEEFPNTVTEVVWEYSNGVPQFSPTYDGRISQVTVSDLTKEAVKQALEGTDYSEGALFFIQKSAAEAHNVTWFEKDLKKLFKYGVHEFYTYPDDKDAKSSKDKKSETDKDKNNTEDNTVQMVKNDILE